ncbi:deoxynucleoside kinase [Chloroflexota bacterium]
MGKLVVIVGNSGVGKTTLSRQLCRWGDFVAGYEQLKERPFQGLFSENRRQYSIHNQVDFLIYRAEQELAIRQSPDDGIQDGGLELDYHVFTHYFFDKGYLDDTEFELCRRVYRLVRAVLPPPDLIIHLTAPLPVLAERFARRNRELEIAAQADLQAMQKLLDGWLGRQTEAPVVVVDAGQQEQDYTAVRSELLGRIHDL